MSKEFPMMFLLKGRVSNYIAIHEDFKEQWEQYQKSIQMNVIEHIAGPLINGIQNCIRCGRILSNYTNTVYPAGQDAPKGFVEGAIIITKKEPWGEQLWVKEHVDPSIFNCIKECVMNVYVGGIYFGQIPL